MISSRRLTVLAQDIPRKGASILALSKNYFLKKRRTTVIDLTDGEYKWFCNVSGHSLFDKEELQLLVPVQRQLPDILSRNLGQQLKPVLLGLI